MAVKKSDEYQHNNEDNAFVDADFVRGGPRRVAYLQGLYNLAPKSDQLKQSVTVVRVISDSSNSNQPTSYRLVDDTKIGEAAGWAKEAGGGATFSTIVAASYPTIPVHPEFLTAEAAIRWILGNWPVGEPSPTTETLSILDVQGDDAVSISSVTAS